MEQERPFKLRAVGGFAEVMLPTIPDLRVGPENDMLKVPTWQAHIYIRFEGNNHLIESLAELVPGQLGGRFADVEVLSDHEGLYYLVATFFIEDDTPESLERKNAFKDALVAAIGEVAVVLDVRSGIEYVGMGEDPSDKMD